MAPRVCAASTESKTSRQRIITYSSPPTEVDYSPAHSPTLTHSTPFACANAEFDSHKHPVRAMRPNTSVGWRRAATSVLATAVVILSVVRADSEHTTAPLMCPKHYTLAENNLVCTRRVEAGVNMTALEARRVCQAHGYDLAGPDATRIANCTAASPCWLGMRCSARRRVERDGEAWYATCRSIASDNDDPAIPESTNWVYDSLTPDMVLKQGGERHRALCCSAWNQIR